MTGRHSSKKTGNLLLINSLSAVLQTLVYTLLIAFLYRYIIDTLGVTKLGLWSIVLSTTSLAGLTNAGITSSITKFISQYTAVNNHEKVQNIIDNALIITIGMTILFAGLAYTVLYYSLPFFLKQYGLAREATAILPYSFVSLFLNSTAGIYMSCLDGINRIYIRSIIIIFSTILYIALSMLLIHQTGLMGLAYAQIIQGVTTLLAALVILKKLLPDIRFLRMKWHKKTFKELFGYSIRVQLVTILQVFTDPIMKLLLSKFGSIDITAYYDMALKIINGFRALIVSAIQATIPQTARLKSVGDTEGMLKLYSQSRQLVVLISIVLYPSLMGFSAIISKIWLGHLEYEFIIALIILAVGLFINTFGVPAYFLNLSTGNLKPNTQTALVTTTANYLLGVLLGLLLGGYGVMLSWTISLIIGTFLLLAFFKKEFPHANAPIKGQDIKLLFVILSVNCIIFISSLKWINEHTVITILTLAVMYMLLIFQLFRKDERILLLYGKSFRYGQDDPLI